MAVNKEYENFDAEIRELLANYKHKKTTIYEPCTLNNVKECLIGMNEELGLLDVNYIFNPHIDIDGNHLSPEALVKLINSLWTLLHHYKDIKQNSEYLREENHLYVQRNKQLNAMLSKLKEKLSSEKNEAKICVASAQRISDHSDELMRVLTEKKAELLKVSKQKDAIEKTLRHEIERLKQDNFKLMDRLQKKSKIQVSCSETCDFTVRQLKDRESKHLAIITQMQNNNQELIKKVLALEEDIVLEGLNNFNLDN
ncbi:hypothetical protein ACJJTC_007799 [Scirpophaga incertulas]